MEDKLTSNPLFSYYLDLATNTRSSFNVRRHTAELASLALGGHSYTETSPVQQPQFPQRRLSFPHHRYSGAFNGEQSLVERSDESSSSSGSPLGKSIEDSYEANRAKRIVSPHSGPSNLTSLIKNSPPETRTTTRSPSPDNDDEMGQSSSTTALLPKKDGETNAKHGRNGRRNGYGAIQEENEFDPEAQGVHGGFKRKDTMAHKFREALSWPQQEGLSAFHVLTDKEIWTKKNIWEKGVKEPVSFLPAVLLGLLLNVLDGLSYGKNFLSCRILVLMF